MTFISRWIVPCFSALVLVGASACTDLTPCRRGTESCVCTDDDACDAVSDGIAICVQGTCMVQRGGASDTVCYDACLYRADGICDDGAAGSDDALCSLGSDCGDCGPRDNPCPGATPVFCPQTPTKCWAATIDCLSVRSCPAVAEPLGCPEGQVVDCNALPAPACITDTLCYPGNPLSRKCVEQAHCAGPLIDCNTFTTCPGTAAPVACYTGETVACMAAPAVSSCTK